MGIVSDYLRDIIKKQVEQHGLVVWFDPDQHYQDAIPHLTWPNTHIAIYKGSFFALRQRVEPLLQGETPPRLVVYVPLAQEATEYALVELTLAGVICKPGQQPPARNTRLSLIARHALKSVLNEETAAAIEKQVEEGKLTLAELDALAEKGKGIAGGVVVTVYETSQPLDVALAFLTQPDKDKLLLSKQAVPELVWLLQAALAVSLDSAQSPAHLREQVARTALVTEMMLALGAAAPPALTSAAMAQTPSGQENCAALVRQWRRLWDMRASYRQWSDQVGQSLHLDSIHFSADAVGKAETFLILEQAWQQAVEAALIVQATPALVATAESRQSGFWAEMLPDVQARWALIARAGQVLLAAREVEQAVEQSAGLNALALWAAYTEGERPLCLLDTYHRHMERQYHNFDFDLGGQEKQLEQLIVKARQQYMAAGAKLAETFLKQYRAAGFKLPHKLRQRDIYARNIKPALAQGKTAYVWVDALRFEMGRELAQILAGEYDITIEAAAATVPTITEIGMAALLPQVGETAVVPTSLGKLALQIGQMIIRNRPERIKFLEEQAGVAVANVKLDELLPKPKKKVREAIEAANLILLTSQEIDSLCEGDNIPLARRTMDGILHELNRAFHVLAGLGVKTIVFTADHGYLFGEELSLDMKIDPPGGETLDLHRRVWVGRGGASSPGYLRVKLADLGLAAAGDDLEIAVPWTFGAFKVKGGATAYFHGGMSLPELAIPVVTVRVSGADTAAISSGIIWTLTPGSEKITTRFFSVQIKGAAAGLFGLEPPKVRLEIRAKGQIISEPISASYGFETGTGNVQMKTAVDGSHAIEPNTLTLMITEEIMQKTVTAYLLDALSGVELARLDKIELAISL